VQTGVEEQHDVGDVREVAVSTKLSQALFRHLDELRHEPTAKRVRALLGDDVVADTTAALLVWEPRRVVPTYAIPLADLRVAPTGAPHEPVTEPAAEIGLRLPAVSDRPVLDPSIPFAVHTTDGEPVELRDPSGGPVGHGFRPTDHDLAGHVILDFATFDWLEEEERIVGHPRDPFHRIDSSRAPGRCASSSTARCSPSRRRAHLLFESLLPVRFYLPREDLTVDLRPSTTRTWCAYKGEASYWSPDLAGTEVPDLAWSYEAPLHDAIGSRASCPSSTSASTSSSTGSAVNGRSLPGREPSSARGPSPTLRCSPTVHLLLRVAPFAVHPPSLGCWWSTTMGVRRT
jgi:uncharacterized protein (DUF427 family)